MTRPAGPVGVVGLGLMGVPIVQRLGELGVEVITHSRRRTSHEAVRGSAAWAESMAEIAATGTVLLSLPADEEVSTVVGELLAHLPPDAIVIDTSTTRPATAVRQAATVRSAGAWFVDAPVSGGPTAAREGELSIMVGGDDHAIGLAEPVLSAIAGRLTVIGGSGAGQIAKACNQAVVGTTIAAVAEALSLAERAGADPGAVRAALLGGYASSRVLELHGRRMIEGDFVPGGRAATQLKDLGIIEELARTVGAEMPVTAAATRRFEQLVEDGHADLDHAAVWLLTRDA